MNLPGITPNSIPPELLTQQTLVQPAIGAQNPGTFSALVSELLSSTQQETAKVDNEVDRLMTGETSNFHEVSLAVARADLSFRFMMQIRDQLVSTYREVMRMQI
ncbi:MAG: flagellar hook-basal body complex protein FliE [Planctomycetaceae bacterium]